MKVKVNPQRPIPGILPKNKWIDHEMECDLNKSEIMRCMQFGTVYDMEGVVIDTKYLQSFPIIDSDNKVVILEPQGLRNFLDSVDNIYSVFLRTDIEILKSRMIGRGDSILDVNKRLENDKILFSKEQLALINLEIDTSNLSIDEIAETIVNNYNKYLENM